MFDLEQSIANWRQQMLAAGIKTSGPLEELEIHLREEIERQMSAGFNAPEAFGIAVEHIGQANLLKQEFQKINHGDKMQKQRRVAAAAFAMILGVYAMVIIGVLLKMDLALDEQLSGFAAVAAMFLSVFVAWHILPRFLPVIGHKAVQSAIGLIGGISGMVWFFAFVFLLLPRFDFTSGQLTVALCWALVPVVALPTASFLMIDKSERHPVTGMNP